MRYKDRSAGACHGSGGKHEYKPAQETFSSDRKGISHIIYCKCECGKTYDSEFYCDHEDDKFQPKRKPRRYGNYGSTS